MKVKVPKVIKIGAHPFGVEFKPHLKIDDGFEACVQFRTQKIFIDTALPPSKRNVDFLHEIVHIIENTFGCNMTEADIDRMAQGLGEFLYNNLNLEFDWSEIKDEQEHGRDNSI